MNEIFTVPHFHKAATAGDEVWVVEREDNGYPVEVSGYMFLAKTGKAVLACSFIHGVDTVEETLDYLIQETEEDMLCDSVSVFRAEDCYPTREYAENSREDEIREEWRKP